MENSEAATPVTQPVKSARRLRKEAKATLREARRILRKYAKKIDPALAAELRARVSALVAARESPDLLLLQQETDRVSEVVDRDLAWAKKSAWREYLESILLAVAIALFVRAFVVEAFKIPSGSMIPTLKVGDYIFVNKFVYGFRVPFTSSPPLKFWQLRKPKRGEVVVFLKPDDPERDYIKRIIAVEGDYVRFRDDQVWLRRRGESEWRAVTRRPVGRIRYCDYEEKSDVWEINEGREYEELLDGKSYRVIGANTPPREGWENAIAATRRLSQSEVTATSDTFGPIPENHVFVLGDNRENSQDSRYIGTVPLDYIKGKALWTWFSRGGRVEKNCEVAVRWNRFFDSVD
jgi:signal peptidase I